MEPTTIVITVAGVDHSQAVNTHCDQAPTIGATQTCVEAANGISDGQVVVTLNNNGDDVDVTFTVNGVSDTVAPKTSHARHDRSARRRRPHDRRLRRPAQVGPRQITVTCDHPGIGTISIGPDLRRQRRSGDDHLDRNRWRAAR